MNQSRGGREEVPLRFGGATEYPTGNGCAQPVFPGSSGIELRLLEYPLDEHLDIGPGEIPCRSH